MHKRNILNSPRLLELKKKRRKILIRKIIIITIVIFLLMGSLTYLSGINRLQISTVEVTGNKVVDTEAIIALAEKEIAGKYLWLFPKRNILLYPKSKLQKNLANEFKRLTDINLSIGNQKKLTVSVEERAPKYTWCGSVPTQTGATETCYFLDKEGFIFDKAPYFSGEVYFKFYGPTGQDESPAGAYLAKGYFNNLILFRDALVDMELKPAVIYLEEGDSVKLFLSRDDNPQDGPQITFKKDSDFEKIAQNLKAAISTEPLLSKFKNEYSKLEYIDLRFGNKVYYLFK